MIDKIKDFLRLYCVEMFIGLAIACMVAAFCSIVSLWSKSIKPVEQIPKNIFNASITSKYNSIDSNKIKAILDNLGDADELNVEINKGVEAIPFMDSIPNDTQAQLYDSELIDSELIVTDAEYLNTDELSAGDIVVGSYYGMDVADTDLTIDYCPDIIYIDSGYVNKVYIDNKLVYGKED